LTIKKEGVNGISILPQDMNSFQGIFVTNALFGNMPVRQVNTVIFSERRVTDELLDNYRKMIEE